MLQGERVVSVVIPTYNRAHLLERIVDSYLQENVLEVIFVDDASSDCTVSVLEKISSKKSRVRYIKLEHNSKQAAAKNAGIMEAKGRYVYFGDDDSYLVSGTISNLLSEYQSGKYSLVAARALYLVEEGSAEYYRKEFKFISSMRSLETNFSLEFEGVARTSLAPACHLLGLEVAKQIMFDPNYKGNGFREETDFVVRVNAATRRFPALCGAVAQINLPRSMSLGGAHQFGGAIYDYYMLKNTLYFLYKNRGILVGCDCERVSWRLVVGRVLINIVIRIVVRTKQYFR